MRATSQTMESGDNSARPKIKLLLFFKRAYEEAVHRLAVGSCWFRALLFLLSALIPCSTKAPG